MNNPADDDERVLFLAPTRKDAAAGQTLLRTAGLPCHLCMSFEELCREISQGGGVVVVPEEAIHTDRHEKFVVVLRAQPTWSNLPILLLTTTGRTLSKRVKTLLEIGNVMLLKRPLEVSEFLNAIKTALRDRCRQYQVRDYLAKQERQTEALRDADRRKDEFLAMLAHELRNPLAPIRNGLEILRQAEGERDVVQQTHGMMVRQVEHLARLVDDLLDVSRITRGKAELRLEVLDLNTILTRAAEATRPLIDARQHRLTISQPGRPVWVSADLTRLTQVISNLLTNAAKYSDESGRIELVLEEDGNKAIIKVRDTGVGIPPEMLPRVFDLFTQIGRTLDRSEGGLGIGLTLVRSLVELHGGTVAATSTGLGQGSEFIVQLPKLPVTAPPQRVKKTAPQPLRRQRILIVDDNADAGDSLATLLKMMGHEVAVVRNGGQALETARRLQPTIAVLDIGLPGMSGYELAALLREEPFGRNLLLIALTGYGQDDDRRRTKEAGFDHHLTKPANIAELTAIIAARPVDVE